MSKLTVVFLGCLPFSDVTQTPSYITKSLQLKTPSATEHLSLIKYNGSAEWQRTKPLNLHVYSWGMKAVLNAMLEKAVVDKGRKLVWR